MKKKYDWIAIQRIYDEQQLTREELKKILGGFKKSFVENEFQIFCEWLKFHVVGGVGADPTFSGL